MSQVMPPRYGRGNGTAPRSDHQEVGVVEVRVGGDRDVKRPLRNRGGRQPDCRRALRRVSGGHCPYRPCRSRACRSWEEATRDRQACELVNLVQITAEQHRQIEAPARNRGYRSLPYQEHSSAGELPSSDKVIWRFMSLAKFLDLMRTSSLYFSRLDILRKLDPFEGTLIRPIREAFERLASDEVAVRAFLQLGNDEPIKPYMMSQFQPDNWRRAQDRVFLDTYVNCWHLSEEESASLWSVYASQVDGVAVKTTVGGLVKSLEATNK